MLEVDKCVLLQSLVERTEICRAEAKGIFAEEVVEVPVDKLPVEAVVIGNNIIVATVGREPLMKLFHHGLRIIKIQTLFT